jgi:hypothetical protein
MPPAQLRVALPTITVCRVFIWQLRQVVMLKLSRHPQLIEDVRDIVTLYLKPPNRDRKPVVWTTSAEAIYENVKRFFQPTAGARD